MHTAGYFSRLSRSSSSALGHPAAFGLAILIVLTWAFLGPVFRFSDTWQLTINTGTTIVTFLMVFLIQNTQNHQGNAVHVKLDELIRAVEGAHNLLLSVEDASDAEVIALRKRYLNLRIQARAALASGQADTGTPELEHPQKC
jgi:low affinity Fe/Cu permease